MESFRPQKSPSSDRFLGLLSSSPPDHSSPSFELQEDDIFDSNPNPNPNPNPESRSANPSSSRSRSFHRDRNFGILAALPEESSNPNAFLGRKPSLSSASASASTSPSPSSSARTIPAAPKPKPDPFPIQQHSAPVNVPVGPGRGKREQAVAAVAEEEEVEDEEEMMLPPHEIVDRAHGKGEPMTTFSVLEGVGRTLKGRDLRRVRNAVWRKTGFLD